MRISSLGALIAPIALVALGVSAAESTDPHATGRAIIAGLEKIVTPNGVQESFAADLGGAKQWVTVRGADRDNPIILYIHGGPAAPETPMAWAFQRPWEDFFTVVQWDQRASGKSWRLNDPEAIAPTLTVDRYRDDAIELIELLCEKYGKRKVIVLGHSWGTIVGLSVAKARPDLVHAYVGVGQIIDFRRGERAGFEWTLEQAKKDGNTQAVRELEALEPYPGEGAFDPAKIDAERKWSVHYGALAAYREDPGYYFALPRLSPEYTPDDIKAWGEGSAFSMKQLFPKLADINFNGARRFETPIFLFNGRHDYTTPSPVAAEWLDGIRAPKKGVIWFEHSAHLIPVEEPGRMLHALLEEIRPIAVKNGDGKKP